MPISETPFLVVREAATMSVICLFFNFEYLSLTYSLGKYATATFKVLDAYAGWSNINHVMNDVKDPVRTLKIAGPLGLGICAVCYLLANVAYFAYGLSVVYQLY